MKKISRWGVQKMLNPPGSTDSGSLSAFIERNGDHINASLTIHDCDRAIHLDFDTWGPNKIAAINRRRYKVKVLRKAVNKFCDKMDEALDKLERDLTK